MAATVGQLRGLAALGLLDRVGYLSCVSGSSWAVTPFVYAPDGRERLGTVTPPERLTLQRLEQMDPATLLAPSTSRFGETLAAFERDEGVSSHEVWCRAVGRTFLGPYGLDHPVDRIGFGSAAGSTGADTVQDAAAAPACHRPRLARPFPIVHATLNWPEDRSDAQHRLPFEYTPLAVGSPRRREVRANGATRTVGGAYIEPRGFDGEPLDGTVDDDGWANIIPAKRPFTLGDMIGASSAFNTPDRDVRGYPHARYWTPSVPGEQVVNDLFTDGGDVDTLSVLGMLRRRLPALVVLLNSVWPLASAHDPERWPEHGQIDPAVSCLFGYPNRRWPHNHVFPRSCYRALVSRWRRAKQAGRPLAATMRLPVLTNPWWGIEGGWEVSVCWIYNDRVRDWESRLPSSVRQFLPADGVPGGPIARFPHYWTVGQNAGALTRLTATQANLLAELSGWGILESADALGDLLG